VNLCQYKSDLQSPGVTMGMTAHMPVKARKVPESGLSGDRISFTGKGRGMARPEMQPRDRIERAPCSCRQARVSANQVRLLWLLKYVAHGSDNGSNA